MEEDDTLATDDFTDLLSGDFTIENQGIEYPVEASLKTIFDPEHGRLFGRYTSYDTNMIQLQKTIFFNGDQSVTEKAEAIVSS